MSFDIVVLVGPREYDRKFFLEHFEHLNNVIGFRKIFIITPDTLPSLEKLKSEKVCFISESQFPFSIDDVAIYHGRSDRNGWYYQQLLKLYCSFVCPDMLDTYLIVDADVCFLRPIEFYKDGKCIYTTTRVCHSPYFEHMKRLSLDLVRNSLDLSGITHHMMFQKKYLTELFKKCCPSGDQDPLKEFWKKFLSCVSPEQRNHSGASEYELYFNYVVNNRFEDIIIRELDWIDCGSYNPNRAKDFIAVHWWFSD
jgi:hypothetical protein